MLRRDRAAVCRRVAAELQRHAWLLDAAAVTLRVFGRLAATLEPAAAYASSVERAIDEVIEESARDSREGRDVDLAPPGETSLVGSAASARAACGAFNRLPSEERGALYRLGVLGETLAGAGRSLGIAEDVVALLARRALVAIADETDGLNMETLK